MKSELKTGLVLVAGALMTTMASAQDLTMYTFYTTDVPYYETVIAAYEAANPGVTINVEVFQNTAYDAALRTAFAGGDIPDIISVEPDARAVGMYPLIEAGQARVSERSL
ncbi:extracellular solute-binding protein [Devosia algicola]|uniref:Extracellular solute-binding protein n=1 Tax=Devosia algicola TaxID=3026418 RepID=A0ABY7YLM3_9HYPH|nr:extracellular solute-binding protein [Devosia algicola]WDR01959.1 extracellular solute-binding protein [Devosia algicola]